MSRKILMLTLAMALFGLVLNGQAQEGSATALDLADAVIVASPWEIVHVKAADMLQTEVLRLTGVKLEVSREMPKNNVPAIVLGTVDSFPIGTDMIPKQLTVPTKAEGYGIAVCTKRKAPTVFLVGRDNRGALFAAGRLIRLLELKPDSVMLASDVQISTAPKYPMRGHQIGYRNTANSYDAWDVATYEQYLRDMAIFGNNAIELIPDIDPEKVDGPVMKRTVWEMTSDLSKMIGTYGLDVWLWVALDEDIAEPGKEEEALAARRALFRSCKYVDEVMVPGGDPGHTAPELLMPFLEKMAALLKERHPDAGLWVSNQGFEHEQNDFFFKYLAEHDMSWLGGVVYGPWTKMSIEEVRARTPKNIKIRRYPDITHTLRCQYTMPMWDQAFAHTLGREPICPRPKQMTHIHNLFAPTSVGFVSYSDGMHDDFNKAAWDMVGWDPDMPVQQIVREYGDAFFGDEHADAVAEGLLMLEQNWVGPLAGNKQIAKTLKHWQGIAEACGDAIESNWRLQLYVFRAHYDAYVQQKLEAEMGYETAAYAALKTAPTAGVAQAIDAAKKALAQADTIPAAPELRKKLEDMGMQLFKTIGFQLSIEPPYLAKGSSRGAVLDYLDASLNDRGWLESQFAEILAMTDKAKQLKQIDTIVNWEDPGPGGFYDNLGVEGKQPHLVYQKTWAEDPGRVESPKEGQRDSDTDKQSWQICAETLYGTPLIMRYEGLDPKAQYVVRATYAGRYRAVMRLVADGKYEVHGAEPQPKPTWPKEYAVPKAATKDGSLELKWELVDRRGCQVAEVWLMKK